MQQAGLSSEIPINELGAEAIGLLQKLIAVPSFSGQEDGTAFIIEDFLLGKGIIPDRKNNNILAKNKYFDQSKQTILLNSHHDTVKPSSSYTLDPFAPAIKNEKLYGLGSNDAGGALVSLLAVFLHFYERQNLNYNFIYAATAEEEISGRNGIEMILPELKNIYFAIVGEPTDMHLATAEKGLLVLDCVARGISGHAARYEGENAIYKAIKDIEWFQSYRFPKESKLLGPVRMAVTVISAGTQHNVIPDECGFTVDIRCNDAYTPEEIFDIVRLNVSCELKPRSMRLRPTSISRSHPFVKAGLAIGRNVYGSPTLSDKALIPFDSVKIGPGDSARSHTADEYIYTNQITDGISIYIKMLDQII